MVCNVLSMGGAEISDSLYQLISIHIKDSHKHFADIEWAYLAMDIALFTLKQGTHPGSLFHYKGKHRNHMLQCGIESQGTCHCKLVLSMLHNGIKTMLC